MRYLFTIILTLLLTKSFAQNSLNKPFEECGINGSITIYDYKTGKWISSNIEDSNFPTLPASTFKVINTLIALETGAVKDENEIIPWIDSYDTTKYGHRPDIYHSMSMKEAFALSAGWVYVELAKKIGKERYRDFLTKSGYGNVNLSINDPDFWNFGDFAISPANQINILIGVYEETLPFSAQSFQVIKDMMIVEQSDDYTLRAKTGWTRDKGKDTGWWIGYVEKQDNVYFFATRLIKCRDEKKPNFGNCRKEIAIKTFQQLGIL